MVVLFTESSRIYLQDRRHWAVTSGAKFYLMFAFPASPNVSTRQERRNSRGESESDDEEENEGDRFKIQEDDERKEADGEEDDEREEEEIEDDERRPPKSRSRQRNGSASRTQNKKRKRNDAASDTNRKKKRSRDVEHQSQREEGPAETPRTQIGGALERLNAGTGDSGGKVTWQIDIGSPSASFEESAWQTVQKTTLRYCPSGTVVRCLPFVGRLDDPHGQSFVFRLRVELSSGRWRMEGATPPFKILHPHFAPRSELEEFGKQFVLPLAPSQPPPSEKLSISSLVHD